jgi:uncharacterized membrane-anchored protein
MIVGHAWPLWTGRVVTMKVVPVDPRDLFRGEYVRLNTASTQLHRRPAAAGQSPTWTVATPLDDVYEKSRRGSLVYVQLTPTSEGDYAAASVSRKPAAGAINLRGRVIFGSSGFPGDLHVDYGLDAFYMQEGSANRVEDAIRQHRDVKMQVAIASSGQARIKTLLIDGVPVDRF